MLVSCHKVLRGFALGAAVFAMGFVGVAFVQPVWAENGPDSVADLAESLSDAVVNISTSQTVTAQRRSSPLPPAPGNPPFEDFFEDFFGETPDGDGNSAPQGRRVQSLGSGFVIDAEGIIITNNHVIADADEIIANFADGSKLKAEVLGRDAKTDLAVLKVNPDTPLTAVPFGDSEKMRVGDWVMAIGNPFGLGGTVTVGIVSARNRNINSGPYDNFIQTDAAINRGNSGGPLFNRNGEVIGINTAIISPSGGSIGIGFSVPSASAVPIIEQLKEFGETRRGWLGVRIQEVTDEIAESLGMDKAKGALVSGVTPTGPAEEAGLLAGDVVLDFNGRSIDIMRDLPRVVADTPVGQEVKVSVLRKGEVVVLDVKIGRLEEGEKIVSDQENNNENNDLEESDSLTILGLTLTVLTPELAQKYEYGDEVTGLVVTAVEEGSNAEEKGIVVGVLLKDISQEPVATFEDVKAKIAALKQEERATALLLIEDNQGDLRFVAVRLD